MSIVQSIDLPHSLLDCKIFPTQSPPTPINSYDKSICARSDSDILVLVHFFSATTYADIIDSGVISVQEPAGGGFIGGVSTFSLTAAEIPDVELLADFFVVDAGVDIVVNGTSLFPQFNDVSQFGPDSVFLGTGVANGGIENPFGTNSNGLPRLTVASDSAGTIFSGAVTPTTNSTITYTPNFTVEDFNSLLVAGPNTIEFFVLNGFQGANLQGDFVVELNTIAAAVPEPGSAGLLGLLLVGCLSTRRRSK